MENHFDLSIKYNERLVDITVQRLSKELPKIMFAVWPKDEELKKYFENINLYFVKEEIKTNSYRTVWHRVLYDYNSKGISKTNLNFEFAVWEALRRQDYI